MGKGRPQQIRDKDKFSNRIALSSVHKNSHSVSFNMPIELHSSIFGQCVMFKISS